MAEQSYHYQFLIRGNIAIHDTTEESAYLKVKAILANLVVERPDLGFFTILGIEADLDSIESIESDDK